MKKSIFGEYDIRGLYEKDISEKEAMVIARAFALYLKTEESRKGGLVVARDKSVNSEKIYKYTAKGLEEEGFRVIGIGVATTPMWNFTIGNEGARGGIMITASHLGDEFVGFKLAKEEARPVRPEEIVSFTHRLKRKGDLRFDEPKDNYEEGRLRYLERYVASLVAKVSIHKKKKIAVDVSGGAAGVVAAEVFKALPVIKNKKIGFKESEHKDDPTKRENWLDVRKVLREDKKFDLGILFDGDADRVVFFDEEGEVVQMSEVVALLAGQMDRPVVVGDVSLGKAAREVAREKGGKFVESRTGHIFIKEIMRTYQADLGAENSGHIYFKENYYTEETMLAFLKVLEIMDKEGKGLKELVSAIGRLWRMEEESYAMKEVEFKRIAKRIRYSLEQEARKISEVDGLKIEAEDWWLTFRMSRTEPVARLNVEADDKKKGEEIRKNVKNLILRVK